MLISKVRSKNRIIINGVMPGIIEFDGGSWDKKTKDSGRYNEEIAKQPLGRFGRLDEVVNFVVSLCVTKNKLTNGEIFTLSGGI